MMGKFHSKHECFLVSADLNKALEDQIWKKKTGFNLANYNMDETLSELSICLEEKPETSPLQVELPPQKLKTDTSKVLTFDHFGINNHSNSNNADKSKLNIEELACGVQLEGSETAKQEWSFTLYDFDGHGRITKEDLSSVLKALYDAVGSSIKLPPNGARTLKLRLSVGQEPSTTGGPLNLKSHASHHHHHHHHRNTANNKVNKCKVKDFSKLNNLTRTQLKCINENKTCTTTTTTTTMTNANTAAMTSADLLLPLSSSANQMETQLLPGQSEPADKTKETNENACLPDRHLASLIQENMERNRIKQLRRHSRNTSDGHHKRRHRSAGAGGTVSFGPATTVTTTTTITSSSPAHHQCPATADVTGDKTGGEITNNGTVVVEEKAKESQDRRNYYLDLAGVENTTSKFQNNPTVPLAGSGYVRTGSGSGGGGGNSGHHRSRSHDIASKCDNHFRASVLGNGVNVRWDKCDNVRRESERLALSKQHQPHHHQGQNKNININNNNNNSSTTAAVVVVGGGVVGGATTATTTTTTTASNKGDHLINPKSRSSFDTAVPDGVSSGNCMNFSSCLSKSSPKSLQSKSKSAAAAAASGIIGVPSTHPMAAAMTTTANATAAGSGSKPARFRPVSLPGHVPVLVSPHYHRRHRNRDKDHSLAMQQVARWIEREHPWEVDGSRLVVQRHEHHHIHEHHHHHHYHHYHEA